MAEKPEAKPAKDSIPLFDGKTLGNWKPLEFGGGGECLVKDGVLRIEAGVMLSGIVWKAKPPATTHYSIELEARRVSGSDFLLALTLPVGNSHCSWICGGWGGSLVGLSNIDGLDTSENQTATRVEFENGKWYRFKIQVTPEQITCWIDGRQVIDLDLLEHKLTVRPGEIEDCRPLGIATYQTIAEYRNLVWKPVPAKPTDP